MIVVDTSVWIDYFNGVPSRPAEQLDHLLDREAIVVGDLVLTEILQGFHSDRAAAAALDYLRAFTTVSMVGSMIAVRAASNYRALRTIGITIRKTIDLLIGTFCIENRYPLLHNDRDFQPMAQHLGLITA